MYLNLIFPKITLKGILNTLLTFFKYAKKFMTLIKFNFKPIDHTKYKKFFH